MEGVRLSPAWPLPSSKGERIVTNTGPQPAYRHPKKKPVKVGLWTGVWVTIAVAAIIGVSSLDDIKGQPFFDNGLLSQIITSAGLVAAALGPSLVQQRRDTADIKHEVKNDHPKNFRVEQDDRHHQIINSQITSIDEQKRTQAMIANLGRKVDAFDKKFDGKVDALREEQQRVQHENIDRFVKQEARTQDLTEGLLSFLRGDPMPIKKDEDPDV